MSVAALRNSLLRATQQQQHQQKACKAAIDDSATYTEEAIPQAAESIQQAAEPVVLTVAYVRPDDTGVRPCL